MVESTSNACPNCLGDGLDGAEFCVPCAGTGYVSSHGVGLYRKNLQTLIVAITNTLSDMEDKIDDVMAKCNDIKEVVDEL